jgi:hypothetical protein
MELVRFSLTLLGKRVFKASKKKNMLDKIQEAVAAAWDLLFKDATGVVPRFLGFLTANPILLLPLGFYLIFLGIKTVRKLITGF